MLGSSSTTSSRASGVRVRELPATVPPVVRAGAVVMWSSVTVPPGVGLDATCELPEGGSREARSAGGCHRPTAPPVADRVVLRPSEAPAAPQVRPDGADGGGLRPDP